MNLYSYKQLKPGMLIRVAMLSYLITDKRDHGIPYCICVSGHPSTQREFAWPNAWLKNSTDRIA
jgi:hypothetical protein